MITVRKATRNDIDRIVEFQQKMAIETESLELNKAILLKGVESVFANPEKGFYVVAEYSGVVVGCTMLTSEWSDWRNGTFLWIQSVYVELAYRQKGVYGKMYSFVKQLVMNSKDYLGLRLYVVMNNKVAQEVYERTRMDGNHYKMYEWIK
jgi:hypothetical protein